MLNSSLSATAVFSAFCCSCSQLTGVQELVLTISCWLVGKKGTQMRTHLQTCPFNLVRCSLRTKPHLPTKKLPSAIQTMLFFTVSDSLGPLRVLKAPKSSQESSHSCEFNELVCMCGLTVLTPFLFLFKKKKKSSPQCIMRPKVTFHGVKTDCKTQMRSESVSFIWCIYIFCDKESSLHSLSPAGFFYEEDAIGS